MTGYAVAISLLALAGAPHCLGMCGGFAAAAAEHPGGSSLYTLGRIGTYMVLGAIAGVAGRWIPGPSWVATTVGAIWIGFMAASLGGWVPEPRIRLPGLALLATALRGRSGLFASFGLGVLNGLLPCGLLYGALALPVAARGALEGALLMGLFGIWTTLPLSLAASAFREVLRQRPRLRPWLALLVLVSGLAGLGMRAPW